MTFRKGLSSGSECVEVGGGVPWLFGQAASWLSSEEPGVTAPRREEGGPGWAGQNELRPLL